MNEKEKIVLSKTIKLCSGDDGRADVFDIMYETGLPYPELKPVLDKFTELGELVAVDVKTYVFTGDPEERQNEIWGTSYGGEKAAKKPKKAQKTAQAQQSAFVADAAPDDFEEAARRRKEFLERFRRVQDTVEEEKIQEELEEDDLYDDDDDDEYDKEEDERYEEYLKALSEKLDDEDFEDDVDEAEEEKEEEEEIVEEETSNDGKQSPIALFREPFFRKHLHQFDRDASAMMTYAFVMTRNNNITYVASENLVTAMLHFHSKAGELLSELGIDADTYKQYFLKCVDDKCNVRGFTPRTKFLLLRAIRLAEEANGVGATANSLHILLAILTMPDCIAVKIFIALGADLKKITEEAEKALRPVGE